MTPKEKDLLKKDLCMRLPYGVKCTTKSLWNGIYHIEGYKDNRFFLDCPVYDKGDDEWMIESIVPYLRPMSSMTENEIERFLKIVMPDVVEVKRIQHVCDNSIEGFIVCKSGHKELVRYWYYDMVTPTTIDWLNKNHFDWRGLIPMGLALPAKDGMYETEN